MLLDEPTAALTGDEVEFLKSLIAKTRERAAIIYVARLSEVLELSDRLYVLKDGSVVASMQVADVTEGELHERMVGRTRQEFFYREHLQGSRAGRGCAGRSRSSPARLFRERQLLFASGEILGIAGLLGSGKSNLARALAGDSPALAGQLLFRGERFGRHQLPQ